MVNIISCNLQKKNHQKNDLNFFYQSGKVPSNMSDTSSGAQVDGEVSATVAEKTEDAAKQGDDSSKEAANCDNVKEQERAHGSTDDSSKFCEGGGKINDEVKVVSRRSTVSSYVDYSRVPPSGSNSVASIFKAASAKEPTFPVKLHLILSNPEYEGKTIV